MTDHNRTETDAALQFATERAAPQIITVKRGDAAEAQVIAIQKGQEIHNIKPFLDPYLPRPERREGTTTLTDPESFTAFVKGGVFGVCSRNQTLDPTDASHLHIEMERALDLENHMRRMSERLGDFAIQGEMVGPRIQGNKYGLFERQLYVFDVYLIDAKTYVTPERSQEIAADMGLASVPWLGVFDMAHTIADLVFMAEGPSFLNGNIPREGIVLRPTTLRHDEHGNRVSFKAINPKFLLKYDA